MPLYLPAMHVRHGKISVGAGIGRGVGSVLTEPAKIDGVGVGSDDGTRVGASEGTGEGANVGNDRLGNREGPSVGVAKNGAGVGSIDGVRSS
jgi:hypothetical protein